MSAKIAWIIGASSFLGTRIGKNLLADGYDVVNFRRAAPPKGDETDAFSCEVGPFSYQLLAKALNRRRAPAFIVHCIGSGSVAVANADPTADTERTVGSTTILADFVRQALPATRLVYLSSAAVYGTGAEIPMTESNESRPVSVYGRNKLAAETICLRSGCCARIVRLFSVYGSPQRKLLFWELGQRLLKGESPVILGGSGEETRDFIDVSDAASAIVTVAEAQSCSEIVNVGSGKAISVRTAAFALRECLHLSARIEFNGLARPGDPVFQTADIGRLTALGFRAKRNDLEEGLADYADWLVSDYSNRPSSDRSAS